MYVYTGFNSINFRRLFNAKAIRNVSIKRTIMRIPD